jgi:hypothetical protein
MPAFSSRWNAFSTVSLLIPRSSATSTTDGSRSPGFSFPSEIPERIDCSMRR